ncbi:uncharacterized protein Bfra_003579 [Botrytis fragariae]|uniref:Uncharacterized protein n=1 Tax=Botrytis fragariae TaxID=1964551 RepID=A0A8H6AWQ6_9HELO|nr:uncharacterized protein Bfra_003579 [Botrytis fragariae]KAF5875126.1 hypothetical protein Bfra_003579 [Botrytis fragariae]
MKIGVRPSDLAYHVFNTSHPLTLHKEELLADIVHFPKYSREAFLKDIAAHSNLKPVFGSDSFTQKDPHTTIHRHPGLIIQKVLARETDPPRLVLRQQGHEPPFPNGENAANLPLQITYLPQPYHGQYQNMVSNSLPYANFQSQLPMTYNVPLNINMAPNHVASQTVDARNHHRNMTAHNGRGHGGGEEMYAGCTSVLEERRDEHTGRVSPRVALRTMMQQALRPSVQREKFERQAQYTQHSHYPRDAFGLSSRGVSVASDTSICPQIDRSLEASIREQLARSGLLRDCPDPEYVNRPMAVDPSIVSCGRALKQQMPFHHHRPQYSFSQPQPFEEVKMSRELSRPPFSISMSPPKVQRNTGIPTYKVVVPRSSSPQIQTYRGVDSVIKEPKRRDSPQSYKVEAGSKFLTKDDYTPTKRIVGYFVEFSSESPKSARRYPIQSLSNHEETTPKPLRHPVKNRLGGASEPEMTQSLIRDGKEKVNKSEETPRIPTPLTETTEGETPIEPIAIIDKYVVSPKKHAYVTVQEVSDDDFITSPDGNKKADLLEDCIKSLATWEKGDRKVLLKLLKVLKRLDDENDARPIEDLKTTYPTESSPRKKKESSSNNSLNPKAACFKDFSSARAHITRTHHERRGLSLQEEITPTSNEMLPMFYPKPLISTEPVWIKTQQRKFIPPPGLLIPFKAHAGRKVPVKTTLDPPPNEDDEGRVAKAMDPRLAGPLLTRFYNKYPLTGTVCSNPPSPPPAAVKNAAEIQEELERLLLQEKEKKAFANPSSVKPRTSKEAGPGGAETSKFAK